MLITKTTGAAVTTEDFDDRAVQVHTSGGSFTSEKRRGAGALTSRKTPPRNEREAKNEFKSATAAKLKISGFSRATIVRVRDVLQDVDPSDPTDVALTLESLSKLLTDLWNEAECVPSNHQQLLAGIDQIIRDAYGRQDLTRDHMDLLRQGFSDLTLPVVPQEAIESFESWLIDKKFNPLAILAGSAVADNLSTNGVSKNDSSRHDSAD